MAAFSDVRGGVDEMVYVGKKGSDAGSRDDMRIPSQYNGNAFDADGMRRSYDPDGEALRHAEELFRRGYVFDEPTLHSVPEPGGVRSEPQTNPTARMPGRQHPETAADDDAASGRLFDEHSADEPTSDESRDTTEAVSAGLSRENTSPRPQLRGMLGGIFDRITTEEILLGALILILFLNGSDDELLIMLVILLFC